MNRKENTKSIIATLPKLIEEDKKFSKPLRPSQLEVLEKYMSDAEKHQTGIFKLATGFGKTRIMSALVESYLKSSSQGRIVVVVPTTDLVENANGDGIIKSFKNYHALFDSVSPMSIGAYYGFSKNADRQVIVTTYNSLKTLQEKIDADDVAVLILDEAHHGISKDRTETIKKFKNAAQYGMTATSAYDEKRDLRNTLGTIIADIPISSAIQEDDLTGCTNILLVSNLKVDLSGAQTDNGYDESKFYAALTKAIGGREVNVDDKSGWLEAHKMISKNVAQFYEKMFNGQKCMINCRSQKEALIQANELNDYFGKVIAKTYTTDYSDPLVLKEFVNGDLPILCQVGKLAEGFDMPGLYYCINYPTCSRVKEEQLGGRCLRKYDKDPFKEAIVVDIAFRHPDCENLLEAIKQNGQVLFMNILQAPSVKPLKAFKPSDNDKDKKKQGDAQKEPKEFNGIKLADFTIKSDPQELLRLMNEAEKIRKAKGIPLISEGMTAEEEFLGKYGLSRAWGLDLLVKAKQKNYLDPITHEKKSFVFTVDTGHGVRMALTNDPIGIKLFEEENKKILFAPEISPGMLIEPELAKAYNISITKANALLAEWENKKYQNPKTHQNENMVFFVKKDGIPRLALTNDPYGINLFEENTELLIPLMQKRKGMSLAFDLEMKYRLSPVDGRRILKELEYKNFYDPLSDTEKPFCERVTSGTHRAIALTDNPAGIREFEKMYRSEIALPMVSGMMGAKQLSEKYGLSEKICKKILEDLKDEVFRNSQGEEELLVAPVYNPKLQSYERKKMLAITADPIGQKLFEKLKGDILFAPEIQAGMLTISDIKEKYSNPTGHWVVRPFITLPRVQELLDNYEGKTYLDPHTGEEKRFVKTVKKDGNIIQVLTEDPLGIQLFEEENKNFLQATLNWGGWLNDYGISQQYKIPQDVSQKLLEKNEGRTFILPDTNETQPLVTWVYFPQKTGLKAKLSLALTPYKVGQKIFEEENKEILSMQEKAVYSPTLKSRLKEASTSENDKLTVIRKAESPEI